VYPANPPSSISIRSAVTALGCIASKLMNWLYTRRLKRRSLVWGRVFWGCHYNFQFWVGLSSQNTPKWPLNTDFPAKLTQLNDSEWSKTVTVLFKFTKFWLMWSTRGSIDMFIEVGTTFGIGSQSRSVGTHQSSSQTIIKRLLAENSSWRQFRFKTSLYQKQCAIELKLQLKPLNTKKVVVKHSQTFTVCVAPPSGQIAMKSFLVKQKS
jgi:hypothetical protein